MTNQLKKDLATLSSLAPILEKLPNNSYITKRKKLKREDVVADKARFALETFKNYNFKQLRQIREFTRRELNYYNLN